MFHKWEGLRDGVGYERTCFRHVSYFVSDMFHIPLHLQDLSSLNSNHEFQLQIRQDYSQNSSLKSAKSCVARPSTSRLDSPTQAHLCDMPRNPPRLYILQDPLLRLLAIMQCRNRENGSA